MIKAMENEECFRRLWVHHMIHEYFNFKNLYSGMVQFPDVLKPTTTKM